MIYKCNVAISRTKIQPSGEKPEEVFVDHIPMFCQPSVRRPYAVAAPMW